MENNFNTDNFEHLLRETTDDFRMYPSKRVWHGIYNDLHPAKRWPSFAILLLLITSITYIGVTNPDKGGQGPKLVSTDPNQAPSQLSAGEANTTSEINVPDITVTTTRNVPAGDVAVASLRSDVPIFNSNLSIASFQHNAKPDNSGSISSQPMLAVASIHRQKSDILISNENSPGSPSYQAKNVNEGTTNTTEQTSTLSSVPMPDGAGMIVNEVQPRTTTATLSIIEPASTTAITTNKAISAPSPISITDESGWMEDYAFRNRKSRDDWKGRMAYQVYVTPSIGYRTLDKNKEYALPTANALVVNPYAPTTTNYTLNHSSAINLEIGGNIIYSASKKLRLKAGLQFNYTNYSINALELNHPTFTTLMLTNTLTNRPVISTRTTTLANTPGPTSRYLNNTSYQVSIPVGGDLKIAGKDKLKVYLGATLQPSYVLGGQSYLISSDMKNYVEEENFLQKFNLNGSIESFITYKTPSGVTINAGPQFRYQFFSSYNRSYTYDEKLYNLGVKLGMTKNF